MNKCEQCDSAADGLDDIHCQEHWEEICSDAFWEQICESGSGTEPALEGTANA